MATLVLVSGEIYFRFFYDTTDSFGMTRVTRRWRLRYFRYNNSRFRDSVEFSREKTAGKRRITFIGDSFTVGQGVANVEHRFANRIRHGQTQWEVHTIARLGWDTAQHIEIIQRMASEDYEFEIVVLAYCLNDIADMIPQWRKIVRRIEGGGRPGYFIDNSYFLDTMHHRLRASRDPDISNYFQFLQNSYEGEVWRLQRQRLEALKSHVAAAGGRLVVVTFPFLHALGPNYPYAPIHDRLGKFWSSLHVPHLDLHAVYRNETPQRLTVNRFDAHPNERAHRLAAAAITDFLKEILGD